MVTRRSTTTHGGSGAQVVFDTAQSPDELRTLAAWYRKFAERAGNPVIWESRLLMAESLEAEADHVEGQLADSRHVTLRGELS
jgi:hypothetical protein